jgi:hypothetical protein
MEAEMFTPIERWAARSKTRAFAYLVGVALLISACIAGGAGVLARIVMDGAVAPAVALTP